MKIITTCLLIGLLTAISVFAAPQMKSSDEWVKSPTYDTFHLYKKVPYDQALRPQFHFTSRVGWINDPNGMVYYDAEWHLGFQHYAKGNASGTKSWGYAVSKDLMRWTQLPHAINPYPNVKDPQGKEHAIWSGSAVVDEHNALGKQSGGVKTLFAMYTATHRGGFFQAGAYSTDNGRTWTLINGGKPIIDYMDGYNHGQRDPYMVYIPKTKSYQMIMGIGGPEDAVRIWKSADLLHWEQICDIPNKSAECINMYSVPVDGNTNNLKWVIANAGTKYEIGDFDGKKWAGFGEKDKDGKSLKFDHGDCYYAAQVFNQAPDHRVVQIGWLKSYPFIDAGMPFTQQLSIPAEINLRTTPDGIRMFRNPVKEIASLYAQSSKWGKLTVQAANKKLGALKPELIDLTIDFVPAGDLTLNVRGLLIQYDGANKEFVFNNTARVEAEKASMAVKPSKKQKAVREGLKEIPAPEVDGKVKLRVLVDRASLELFVNDGQAAASFVVVPDPKNRALSVTAGAEVKIASLEVNELKSCWTDK